MDRVRTRDSAYVPRGVKSPRTGSPNPVRAIFHRTASEGSTALDPAADNIRPQYFYESEPLTPVCHTSVTPRLLSARLTDPYLSTPRSSSQQMGLQPYGGVGAEAMRGSAGNALRPTSAPSSRKRGSAGNALRPTSAPSSAATRHAAAKISGTAPACFGLERDALERQASGASTSAAARARGAQEPAEQAQARVHAQQIPPPSSPRVSLVCVLHVSCVRASCVP
jgi:hypothetical protein